MRCSMPVLRCAAARPRLSVSAPEPGSQELAFAIEFVFSLVSVRARGGRETR